MSTEQTAAPTAAQKMKPMQVFVRGRIDSSRSFEGVRYTSVLAPALDQYSSPQIVEFRSKQQLGQKGEEVALLGQLGGFKRKSFQATDKSTGEVRSVTPVVMTLDLVEA